MAQQQTEDSIGWEDFRAEIEKTWEKMKAVDLEEGHQDLDDLSQKIRNKTGQAQEKVKKQVQTLAEKFNYPFE